MINIQYGTFFRGCISFIKNKEKNKIQNFVFDRPGIYKIKNIITNEYYIGQSINVKIRLQQHRSLLRNNRHKYKTGELTMLQKAWNKYGEENFAFDIVEFCEIEKLNEREIFWIDYYKCNHAKYRNGYNANDGGDGSYGNKNVKGRIQINNGEIQKMIFPEEFEQYEKQGFIKGILENNKNKSNANRNPPSGDDHWTRRCGVSEETKLKQSIAHKGRPATWNIGRHQSEETKIKKSLALKGKKMSEKSRQKLSKSKSKPVQQLTKNGQFVNNFDSAIEAEKMTGIKRSHISQCCNGKRKSAGGYGWRFGMYE